MGVAIVSLATHTVLIPFPVKAKLEGIYTPFVDSVHETVHPNFFRPLDESLFPTSPVILEANDARASGERLLSRRRSSIAGEPEIGGNRYELQATYDACLQVGQFSRARALAHRLGELYPPNSPALVAIFNQYLRRVTSDLTLGQRTDGVESVEGWIENDMKKAGVRADPMTYALTIKAALHRLSGSRRDRTVRRYWNMVKELELESEVAGLHNILTDYDLGTISEICPMELDTEDLDEYLPEASGEDRAEEIRETQGSQQPNTESADLHIREIDQKGEGMKALKKTLSMFSSMKDTLEDTLSSTDTNTVEGAEQRQKERQIRLERDALDSSIERWRKDHETLQRLHTASDRQIKSLGTYLFRWQQILAQRLKEEIALCEAADTEQEPNYGTTDRREYGPFLRLVNPDQLAALTILTVFQRFSRSGSTHPMRLSHVVTSVSRAVEAEAFAEILSNNLRQKYGPRAKDHMVTKSINRLAKIGLLSRNKVNVDKIRKLWRNQDHYLTSKIQSWPVTIHAKVGAALCSHLLEAAKITIYKEDPKTGKHLSNVEPVFQRMVRYEHGKRRAYIAIHPIMVEKLAVEPPSGLIAKQVPMVVQPRPWTSFEDGGYLTSAAGFLRIKNGEVSQKKYAEAAMERGDLQGYFDGLNVLGETGWRINSDVFQVMREAWNTGDAVANIAPENPQIELPPRPANSDMMMYRRWSREVVRLENARAGLHSERCFQNFQLEIAKTFLNETFYLPHNIDFRGRAYPIPPYFHQMCADHVRGLLLFAEGRKLGETGLRWLKIHLANVYGYDKASLTEREAFADDHLDDIKDSTDNPLGGKRWWLEAEDPWQCLATSFELRKAIESPDPTKFVSHIPVHQDGSCNGLQHYAALGGDIEGAQQVNLEPSDRPSDVYTGVAELVKAQIEQDLEKGDKNAKLLHGKISRKIVKTTVMTNVYGVTFLGAMRQVRKRLDELHPELGPTSIILSAYVARKIFHALGTLFSGAHGIQYWLGDCANRINTSLTPEQLDHISQSFEFDFDNRKDVKKPSAKIAASLKNVAFRCSVTWTTPLKLPVVQPYRDSKIRKIKTKLQTMHISTPTLLDNVNKRKQLQGFPPNFIHSLDATHMMLSAVKCKQMGMTFSAVHDSFWTHAADVDRMNQALRSEFIRMHSEDVVGRLAAEFKARFGNNLYQATIPRGTDLASKILKCRGDLALARGLRQGDPQFKLYEAIVEHKRQKLLRSSDPKQREEGSAMVTPASIFEADGQGDNSLSITNSLGETAIGHIPQVTSKETLKTALLNAQESAENVDLGQSILPGTDDQLESLNSSLLRDLKHTLNDATSSATNAMKEREAQKKQKQEKQKEKTGSSSLSLWLPLHFANVPKRGDWDVSRLRSSEYFFS
ncbi:MAG: hypothetical protein Q9160_000229 [Pyrenula sp. 1 TL-2023]